MLARLTTVIALAMALTLSIASPALASSYSARITKYVADRPAQARVVQMALVRAGWGYSTANQKALLRQAILVSAGESGMNPVNNGNPSCSGLFQIYNGKPAYGRWSTKELADPKTRAHYTLSERPWRLGTVMTYYNGRFLRWENGWYRKPGTSGARSSDWGWGKIAVYAKGAQKGWGHGWYRAPLVTYYAPRAGEYKIFNPVFNAEVARRMHGSRGWQPWTVARKLGYR